ncbi:MAG: hypothetical protein ACFB4I_09365 [Cyanophyceae cyanobacterium]
MMSFLVGQLPNLDPEKERLVRETPPFPDGSFSHCMNQRLLGARSRSRKLASSRYLHFSKVVSLQIGFKAEKSSKIWSNRQTPKRLPLGVFS